MDYTEESPFQVKEEFDYETIMNRQNEGKSSRLLKYLQGLVFAKTFGNFMLY